MIKIEELRIGNCVINKKANKIIEITGLSDLNIVEFCKNGKRLTLKNDEIEPIPLDEFLVNQLVDKGILSKDNSKKDEFFFPSNNSTYALVYDRNDESYYIGLSATDNISAYSRISRPFYQYHKLQNAYYTVYNKEIRKITS
ncbi:hypothetical protein [Chryseobacterium sp. SL1]|uniref:hypothetical protein n=1 Tax=Chryseobacterium sp. SL1 TaxID=2995159 RepID=UPI0022723E05|nr:hypothetical protein [Chryseobacterium sp. SL1]MCY1662757.1 hypothetical protein [Chryseobacterium sp. SL1]